MRLPQRQMSIVPRAPTVDLGGVCLQEDLEENLKESNLESTLLTETESALGSVVGVIGPAIGANPDVELVHLIHALRG